MSQKIVDFANSDPSGDNLLDVLLPDMYENIKTTFMGTSRPTDAEIGTMWIDNTDDPWILKIFTGVSDIVVGTLDSSTLLFTPSKPNNAESKWSGAIAAPTASDDTTQGYEPGSFWIYNDVYICIVSTEDAAQWVNLTALSIPDDFVTGAMLATNSVGNYQLIAGQITYNKFASTMIASAEEIRSGIANHLVNAENLRAYLDSNGVLHVQDQKAAGTDGGDFTSGADRTRDLSDTPVVNGITGASVGSNQITLPAGTYEAVIRCPAVRVGNHRAKLYNVTDGADIAIGSNAFASNAGSAANYSFVKTQFTLAGTKVLEVRHRCESTLNTFGFGASCNFGSEVEIYTDVFIRKIK